MIAQQDKIWKQKKAYQINGKPFKNKSNELIIRFCFELLEHYQLQHHRRQIRLDLDL